METNFNLITFGDSWTLNCEDKSWPNILADLLNRNLVQLGHSGSDNKTILHKILDQEYSSTDIVVVMWSHPYRVFSPYNPVGMNLAMNNIDDLCRDTDEADFIKAYRKWYLREPLGEWYIARDSLQQALLVQEFFQNRNIVCIQCNNYVDLAMDNLSAPEVGLIDKERFYGFGTQPMSWLLGGVDVFSGIQVMPTSEDDREKMSVYWSNSDSWTHPSELGHELIAHKLKDFLDNAL